MLTANPLQSIIPSQSGQRLVLERFFSSHLGLALSSVVAAHQHPIVIITQDTITAARLKYELHFFNPHYPIILFPDWETLPYDHFSPHQDIISERLSALYTIPTLKQGAVIISITTLMQQLSPCHFLEGNIFLLKPGDPLDINSTRKRLENAGYRCVTQANEHGEFAVRGAIIDLFPMGSYQPYRIDLFDNEIDSIRTFSKETQRSLEKIDKIEILPAKEFPLTEDSIEFFRQQWRGQFSGNPLNCPIYQDISEGICPPGIEYYLPYFFEKTATFFDYLPSNSWVVTAGEVHPKAEEFWREIHARYEQHSHDITRPLLPPLKLFIPTEDIFNRINQYTGIKIQTITNEPLALHVDHKADRPLQALKNFIDNYNGRILFCAETAGRREVLLQLFNTIQFYPHHFSSWEAFLNDTEQYGITVAPLEEGLQI